MKIQKIESFDSLYIKRIFSIEQETFSRPWTFDNITYEIKNPHALPYVFLIDNVLTGYIFAIRTFDEIQINKICIDCTRRNMGYGYFFLREFLDAVFTDDISSAFLEVNVNNIPAVNLYKKAGFTINRIRPKIYDDLYDGAEMVLVHH